MSLVARPNFSTVGSFDVCAYEDGYFCLRRDNDIFKMPCNRADFETLVAELLKHVHEPDYIKVPISISTAYVRLSWYDVENIFLRRTRDTVGLTKSVSVSMTTKYGFSSWDYRGDDAEEVAATKMRELMAYLSRESL